MAYYAYYETCEQCGVFMGEHGMVEQEGGRRRHYCSNACRQRAYRERKAKPALRNTDLLRFEQHAKNYLGDGVARHLVGMAKTHGLPAAQRACEVAIIAAIETRRLSIERPSRPLPVDQAMRKFCAPKLPNMW